MLLKFAVQDFKDDREFKNLSPTTIDGYIRTLKEFQNYCAEQEIINAEDVTGSVVKQYLLYCQKTRKNNPTSINHKLHNLKIFFNYLEEIDIITERRNPVKKVGFIKEEIKIDVFTDDQVRKMLQYYQRLKHRDKTFWAYRDYTIIVTLISTALRLGELVNLKWDDIDFVNQTVTVMGKKRQQSSIPMTDKFKKELSEYRVFCEQQFGELSEYVFTNRYNVPLTANAVQNIFKRLKKIMNFKNTRVSAHTFRHYVAVKMIRQGADVFTVQKMLRHSSLKMTMRYVHLFGTALAEQNNKYNPLNTLEV